jgi:hypothetical protein
MKFLCKALSLSLLLSVSARAVDLQTVVPWCAAAAVGEYVYHSKKDTVRKPEDKSPMMRTVTDVVEAAAGGIVLNVVNQEPMNPESVAYNTVTAYLSLMVAKNPSVNAMLSKVPGVRGLMCDDCPDKMTRQSVTRLGVSTVVVNALVKKFRDVMTYSFKADAEISTGTTPTTK